MSSAPFKVTTGASTPVGGSGVTFSFTATAIPAGSSAVPFTVTITSAQAGLWVVRGGAYKRVDVYRATPTGYEQL